MTQRDNRGEFRVLQAKFFKWVFRTVLATDIPENHFDPEEFTGVRIDGLCMQFDQMRSELASGAFKGQEDQLEAVKVGLERVGQMKFVDPQSEQEIWAAAKRVSDTTSTALWAVPPTVE